MPDGEDSSPMLIAALLEKGNLPTITNHQHAPGTVLGTGSRRVKKIDSVPTLTKFIFWPSLSQSNRKPLPGLKHYLLHI